MFTEIFCALNWCWLGQAIDNLFTIGMTLLDYAIRFAPVWGLMYALYWIWLVIRTIKTGSPEPILNHIMGLWHLIAAISNLFVNVLRLIRP